MMPSTATFAGLAVFTALRAIWYSHRYQFVPSLIFAAVASILTFLAVLSHG